jgi:hypothetical protein
MAFILVFKVLNLKAYPFMHCQIVVLHVQSKASAGMAALQGAHGSRHDFFIFSRMFCFEAASGVGFLRQPVVFCKCIMAGLRQRDGGKPLADVPFSC